MNIKETVNPNYFLVLTGNLIALGCGFVVSIISTHVIIPVDYGFYKAFLIGLQMFATFSHLGFHYTLGREFAITNSQVKRRELNSTAFFLFILLYIGVNIIILSAFLLSEMVFEYSLPNYLLVSAIFVFVMLLQNYTQQKLQGEGKMVKYTVLTMAPQVLMLFFFAVILMLDITLDAKWVIASYIIINILIVFCLNEKNFKLKIKSTFREILLKNRDYGFQLYIGSLFSVTSTQLLNLLIANISGLKEYAFFALGVSLASPMTFVASTLGTVQFKKNVSSRCIEKKEVFVTLFFSGSALVGYYIFLNYIMHYLIGSDYLGAISYANILLIYYTIMGFGDYLNNFIRAKGNGKKLRNGAIISGITLIISALIFIPSLKIKGLIIAMMFSAVAYLISMIVIYKISSNKESIKLTK